MDDLIKMCDKLEECKKKNPSYENEITCTRRMVKSYVNGDVDKILNLKAELKIHDYNSWDDIGKISLVISVITLCITMFGGILEEGYVIYCLIGCMILIIVCFASAKGIEKYGHRDKWRRYIEVIVEDIEKENEL